MAGVITILVLFVPLLLVLWFANLADGARERSAQAETPLAAPALTPLEMAAAGLPGDPPPAAAWDEVTPAPVLTAPATRDDSGGVLAGVAYGLLSLLYLGLIFFGIIIQSIGLIARGPAGPQMTAALRQSGLNLDPLLGSLPQLGAALWIPALLGIVLLLRPVRRLIARLIAIDSRSTVHAVALSFIVLIIINMATTLIFLPQLATLVDSQALEGQASSTISSVWAQELMMALMAVIGVGWLARRSWGRSIYRLYIVRPTWTQVAIGVGAGLLMIPLVLGVQALAGVLHVGMDTNVEKLSNALIGPLTQSALGIITMGVAAALGEEAVFRGALQPRFGLVLTAILFALLHSQDGLSLATLIVLIIGFVLGFLRARTNTSTTMIMHAIYNSSLGLLAFLNVLK